MAGRNAEKQKTVRFCPSLPYGPRFPHPYLLRKEVYTNLLNLSSKIIAQLIYGLKVIIT